jgi:glucokinase
MTLKEVVLGIDIGGTSTVAGYVDRNGACIIEDLIPTLAHQPADQFFQRLHTFAKQLLEKLGGGYSLRGIGIGAPNANYYKGTIESPPNLSWDYVDVKKSMAKYYTVPVALTNDANAAALGEMMFGAAKGMKDFIVITLGTGVGSGVVANGKLIYGADGFAGELGHTIYDSNGRICGCGRKGCLEAYASASGIKRTVFELMAKSNETSELRDVSFHQMTAKMIFEAALRGDVIAKNAFEVTGKILGMKLADSVAHTSPEAIILFGGLAQAGDLIIEPTKRSMEEALLNIFQNKVKIIPSAMPEGNSAVLGAAALIWNELK